MPYARMTTFALKQGNAPRAQQVLDNAMAALMKLSGFQSVTAFHDDSYETAGTFSIWDTRANAEGATPALRDLLQQQAQQMLAEAPQTRVYEVYSEPVQTFPIGRP